MNFLNTNHFLLNRTIQTKRHNMASILIAGAALLAGGTAARIGLRSIARGGTVLPPFLASIAGNTEAADTWAKGGFQGRMDRKEAVEILGLK